MSWLGRALRIRPGEGAVAFRMLALMLTVWAGMAIGGNAVESLLFARFGPGFLPVLYLALGPVTSLAMIGTAGLVARLPRTVVTLPVVLAAVVVAGRVLLLAGDRWVYPVLWLLMMVVWTVQGIAAWGLAGAVSDTRQAKRLFPLYGAGLIAGGVVGGFLTRPLAALAGVENLLVLWAALLAGGFVLARSIAARAGGRLRAGGRPRRGGVRAMSEGLGSVRRSSLLRWMAVTFGLFGLLYFAIALPFARAATARFPAAEQLAGFLGTFFGITNGVALLVSLAGANRLFARFGVGTMVVILGLVYAAGFTTLAVGATFAAIVAFRFLQLVWVNGVWASGWQALYGVVSPDRRDRVRVFMEGVPWQIGVVLSGAVLLVADRLLGPSAVFVAGAVAGGAATYAAWRARREYSTALVEALRQGWPDVFVDEEEPFGGFRRDAAGVDALLAGLADPHPGPRRMAVKVLATLREVPDRAREALIPLLDDPDALVRTVAVGTVTRWGGADGVPTSTLRRLLSDPEPAVRAGAASALAATDEGAMEALRSMASSADPQDRATALMALGHAGVGFDIVASAVSDDEPDVRAAAAATLARFPPERSVAPLAGALADRDAGVRGASAEALARLGGAGAAALLDALTSPELEDAALRALAGLEVVDREWLLGYAGREAGRAARYHRLWQQVAGDADARLRLLADSVRHRALGEARRALMAVVAVTQDDALRLAVDYVESHHPEQRANAVETVETVADPRLVRPLLPIWDPMPAGSRDHRAAVLMLMDDDDAWVRACAALAAPVAGPEARAKLERAARTDPDDLVRETAGRALRGDSVETMATLPLMERIMFLRTVPLFADLAPEDLKHVAEAATERLFQDGTVIAEQGELGEELYLVTAGEIRVMIQREGSPAEVARRKAAEYVGEMGVISGEPRMASLVAAGDVRVLSLDRIRFERILVERPAVAMAVMQELSDRLRTAYAGQPLETKI